MNAKYETKYVVCFTWRDYGADDGLFPNYRYWNGRNMFGDDDDDTVLFDTESEAQAVIDQHEKEYEYGTLEVLPVKIGKSLE